LFNFSGSVDGWLSDPRCKNEDPDPGLGDEGFSESVPVQASIRCHQRSLSELPKLEKTEEEEEDDQPVVICQRRNSTSKVESGSKVFQQLRVALEKIPAKKLPILLTSGFVVGSKRSKVVEDKEDQLVKKFKLDEESSQLKSSVDSSIIRSVLNQVRLIDYFKAII
jgi:hypothetical protein